MKDVDAPASTAAGPAGEQSEEDSAAAIEQRLIQEEYRIWKKNSPFLYDLIVTSPLEWPSLTVQWMPDRIVPEGKDYSIQRLLLGTHTSPGEAGQPQPQNFLLLAEVRLPTGADASGPASKKKPSNQNGGAAAAAAGAGAGEEEEEEGAYGAYTGKIEIVQQIPHLGEVNRARYSPSNPNLIATKSPSKQVYLFDKTRHASNMQKPVSNEFKPDLVLSGHTGEGYGLAWNPHKSCEGQLISGSEDTLVCMWDVESSSREAKKSGALGQLSPGVAPLNIFRGHRDVVEDVGFSHFVTTMFASCGDDARLLLWDTRTPEKPSATINDGPSSSTSTTGHHTGNINCLAFNHLSPNILASGSSDKRVNLWDLRRLHQPIHSLVGHTDEVFTLSFSPFSPDILASCGADRKTFVWDLARIGADVAELVGAGAGEEEDAADGPPELLFIHSGHCEKIADFSWNPNKGEEWMCATVDDGNVIQLWQSQYTKELHCGSARGHRAASHLPERSRSESEARSRI